MSTTSSSVLAEGLRRAHWSVVDLWRAALGVGGSFSKDDIEAVLGGRLAITEPDHDILATALNDHFVEKGQDHPVPYWRDLSLDGGPP